MQTNLESYLARYNGDQTEKTDDRESNKDTQITEYNTRQSDVTVKANGEGVKGSQEEANRELMVAFASDFMREMMTYNVPYVKIDITFQFFKDSHFPQGSPEAMPISPELQEQLDQIGQDLLAFRDRQDSHLKQMYAEKKIRNQP